MKSVVVQLKLPEDLSVKARELCRNGDVKSLILKTLRSEWITPPTLDGVLPVEDRSIPIWGSIPAEQNRG